MRSHVEDRPYACEVSGIFLTNVRLDTRILNTSILGLWKGI